MMLCRERVVVPREPLLRSARSLLTAATAGTATAPTRPRRIHKDRRHPFLMAANRGWTCYCGTAVHAIRPCWVFPESSAACRGNTPASLHARFVHAGGVAAFGRIRRLG